MMRNATPRFLQRRVTLHVYAPYSAVDMPLPSHSRELVREAMALLRSSDYLESGQRLRDELQQERREPPRRNNESRRRPLSCRLHKL